MTSGAEPSQRAACVCKIRTINAGAGTVEVSSHHARALTDGIVSLSTYIT